MRKLLALLVAPALALGLTACKSNQTGMSNGLPKDCQGPGGGSCRMFQYWGTVGGPPRVSYKMTGKGWDEMTGNLLFKNNEPLCDANRQAVKDQLLYDETNAPDTAIEDVVPQMVQAGQLNNCGPPSSSPASQAAPAPPDPNYTPNPYTSTHPSSGDWANGAGNSPAPTPAPTPTPTSTPCNAQPSQASSTGYTYNGSLVRGPGCDTTTGHEIDNACQYDTGWTCPPGIVSDPYGNYVTSPSRTPTPAPTPPAAPPPAPCFEANGSTGYSC
jgi:hypothetical protein